ncbi:MAG: type IV toxin-antitoxin system AbiEi family antitoxin [Candidatus Micrarchaeota archaeon]
MNTKSMRKGLGSIEAEFISDLVSEGKVVFSIGELAEKTGSQIKARKMASKLAKKKWLERIARGTYLVLELGAGSKPEWTADSYGIASKLVNPYYVGYYNMLNDYGWTDQIPFSVTVATTKRLKNREIHGVKYIFVTITKNKFFGTITKYVRGHEIVVSDPEKTLVDAFDHPEYCGGINEVAKMLQNASAEVDWNKVVQYAEKLGNGAVFKRLGYILELMQIELDPAIMDKIKKNISAGYSLLYPGAAKQGKYNCKWNLVLNIELSKERVLA